MNKKAIRRWLLALLATVVIVIALIYSSRPELIKVALVEVGSGEVRASVANTRAGTVKACRRARLSPAMGGQIAALPAREGSQVKQGDILLELWNDDLKAQLSLTRSDIEASRARAEEACTTAEVAQKESRRMLTMREEGLASEEAVEMSVGKASSSAAACRAVTALVRVSQAREEVALAALERTLLRAPFDGAIAEVNGELGEFVTPSPVGIPTPPAVDLIDNSCLYVTAPIDEVDAPSIRAGMPARISLDAFPKEDFKGVVRRVAPYVLELEKQARTVEIEVKVEQLEERDLLAGYSADVEVILEVREQVLRVPTQSVLEDSTVLLYREIDGVLESRPVQTGVANWEYTEILSGLKSGDQIVLSVDREGVGEGVQVQAEQ
ncbi:MAG: efflux RND transporter periplasmic adaptor subunit [Gammaproteobacteria bacterium]|jgi:HlyD family secretion protein|nr:efflux RND transporter periplasmic adaptor subunit [Gammaproteobacteria bacterium]